MRVCIPIWSSLHPATTVDQQDYLSLGESASDGEDDSELFGFLQESPTPGDTSVPADTSSTHNTYFQASQGKQIGCTTNTPLISPASQLATNSFVHLKIHSPIETGTDMTQKSSQPVVSPPIQLQIPVNRAKGKRASTSTDLNRDAKRFEFLYNPTSKTLRPATIVTYIGETIVATHEQPQTRQNSYPIHNPSTSPLVYYPDKHKDWHNREIFKPALNAKSQSGLPRIDIYVYTIDANIKTREQRAKKTHQRNMHIMQTPIERFYPELWDAEHATVNKSEIVSGTHLQMLPFYREPHENSFSVIRTPASKFQKVPTAIEEPTEPLYIDPPPQQHSLSEQGIHLMHCQDPIELFDAIYPPHELENILEQIKIFRLQNNWHEWLEPTYREIRCFIGPLLWTSLVQLPNVRAYFTTSQIYHLPHFKAHMSRNRFEQLLSMLHFTNNQKLRLFYPQPNATRLNYAINYQL